MKVFLQGKDESIIINGDISVTVLKIEGDEVVLGIDAPQWLSVEEIPDRSSSGYSVAAVSTSN